MQTVTILLSTYNGEKYLSKQLDSLLAQQGVNVRILVRDDGSTDRTLEILEDYKARFPNCVFVKCGLHKGFSGSFLALASDAGDSDYYAFCDQDDVWATDKLQTAVSKIDSSSNIPQMYFSNAMLVDSRLRPIKEFHRSFSFPPMLSMRLTDNPALGCTMVFNKEALNLFVKADESRLIYYDYWMYLLCSYLGLIVYDNSCRVLYRQHDSNAMGYLNRNIWLNRIKKLIHKPHIHEYPAAELIRIFGSQFQSVVDNDFLYQQSHPVAPGEVSACRVSPAELEKLQLMADYRKNLSSRMRLLFHKEIASPSAGKNFWFKLQVLLGIA